MPRPTSSLPWSTATQPPLFWRRTPAKSWSSRLLDGAHEEQHCFNLKGLSWKKEIDNPDSPLIQAQTIGISEAFNLRVDQPYAAGDYLYYYGAADDLWLGLWGIIRAYDRAKERPSTPVQHSRKIPAAMTPPEGAVVRKFELAAIQCDICYNRFGDHDPDGLLFVPLDQAEAVRCREKATHPTDSASQRRRLD